MSTYSVGFDIFAKDRASATFDKVSGRVDKTGGELDKWKHRAKIAAVGALAFGAAAIKMGSDLIGAGEQASTSNARIEQIVTSMGLFGEKAGAVSKRVQDLANKTALATGVDQNAIKMTQAKLLTFSELAKTADSAGGAFDRATAAAVDMAAAGFGSAEMNAVQLGKALQDPIKGITALARSGVTFTEAEKERIKTLVESNKMGEAQALVLEAIEKQVGGTAKATANASDQMKVGWSQVKEQVGQQLLPVFNKFSQFVLTKILPAVTQFLTEMQNGTGAGGEFADKIREIVAKGKAFAQWLGDNGDKVKALAVGLGLAVTGFKAMMFINRVTTAVKAFNIVLRLNPIGLVVTAIGLLIAGLIYAYQESETFRKVVDTAFKAIAAVARWLWNNVFAPVIRFILNGFASMVGGVASFLRALGNIPGFGWAKTAADKMDGAARKARELASGIRNIPDKTVTISVQARANDLAVRAMRLASSGSSSKAAALIRGFAGGGTRIPAGLAWVGERGPELIDVPEGSNIYSAEESARMAASSGGARSVGGDVYVTAVLKLDGREVHRSLLKVKREDGKGLDLE